jgi:hypothetical protein
MPPPGPPGPPGFPGPPGPPGPQDPMDESLAPEGPARPGWRTVIKRPEPSSRRKGKAAAAAAAPPPPPPPPAIEAPRPEMPSWAQWRREHSNRSLTALGLLLMGLEFRSEPQCPPCGPWSAAVAGRGGASSSSGSLWWVASLSWSFS